jgi:hypothetical protein
MSRWGKVSSRVKGAQQNFKLDLDLVARILEWPSGQQNKGFEFANRKGTP